MGLRDGWMGEKVAFDEANRLKETREKYRQESLYRPEAPPLISVNQIDRNAAREAYQNMEASMKVGYKERTGHWIEGGLNSAQVVDEIIHAINVSRVAQAEDNTLKGKGTFS